MNKLKDEETRLWYADRLLDNGWSEEIERELDSDDDKNLEDTQ